MATSLDKASIHIFKNDKIEDLGIDMSRKGKEGERERGGGSLPAEREVVRQAEDAGAGLNHQAYTTYKLSLRNTAQGKSTYACCSRPSVAGSAVV
jgi:hypothetical protein